MKITLTPVFNSSQISVQLSTGCFSISLNIHLLFSKKGPKSFLIGPKIRIIPILYSFFSLLTFFHSSLLRQIFRYFSIYYFYLFVYMLLLR